MKAKDRKTFTEAWSRHVTQLGQLAAQAGAGAEREWKEYEPVLRNWVKIAGDKSFPEPTAAGELPNGVDDAR